MDPQQKSLPFVKTVSVDIMSSIKHIHPCSSQNILIGGQVPEEENDYDVDVLEECEDFFAHAFAAELEPLEGPLEHVHPANDFNTERWNDQLRRGFVNLSRLSLPEVPKSLLEITAQITVLYLSYNNIRYLPPSFFDELPSLGCLDVRRNQLKALPEFSCPHYNIRIILAQENELKFLPYTLGLATKLRHIDWDKNPLEDPPLSVLCQGTRKIVDYLNSHRYSQPEGPNGLDQVGTVAAPPKCTESVPSTDATPSTLPAIGGINKRAIVNGDKKKEVTVSSGQFKHWEQMLDSRQLHQERMNHSIARGPTPKSKADEQYFLKKKYSFELWKDVPFNGIHLQQLMKREAEEIDKKIASCIKRDIQAILQKTKDREALRDWRTQQPRIRNANYQGLEPPFAVDVDGEAGTSTDQAATALPNSGKNQFSEKLEELIARLRRFEDTSGKLPSVKVALDRIIEVENIKLELKKLNLAVSGLYPS